MGGANPPELEKLFLKPVMIPHPFGRFEFDGAKDSTLVYKYRTTLFKKQIGFFGKMQFFLFFPLTSRFLDN